MKAPCRSCGGIVGAEADACYPGLIFKPWYITDANHLCVCYDIQYAAMDTRDIACTTFKNNVRNPGFCMPSYHPDHPYMQDLVQQIRDNGQQTPIDVFVHHLDDWGVCEVHGMIEDPKLQMPHCIEGHHRLMACEQLRTHVRAKIHHLYDFDASCIPSHYVGVHSDSFWRFNGPGTRHPWFTWDRVQNPASAPKYHDLMTCLQYIRDHPYIYELCRQGGEDIGCAEGVYTRVAAETLGCMMLGIDHEPGRIIRACLASHDLHAKRDCYHVWDTSLLDEKIAPFAMILSVMHHMTDPATWLGNIAKHKQVLLIETVGDPMVVDGFSGSLLVSNSDANRYWTLYVRR